MVWQCTFDEQAREHFLFVLLQSDHGFTGDPDHKVFLQIYLCFDKVWNFSGLHVPNVQTVPRDCIKVLVEKNVEFVPKRDKIRDRIFYCRTLVIYLYLLII